MNIRTVAKHIISGIADSLKNSLMGQYDSSTVYVTLFLQRAYKITKSGLPSLCLSVGPNVTTQLALDGFS